MIIKSPKYPQELRERFRRDGLEKIHVLSDFDKTLTYAFVDGESIPSIISLLRDGNHLSKEYAQKAHALYNKYQPIEADPNISFAGKKKAMKEWWETHFDLLIESKLRYSDIEDIVKSEKLRLRAGVLEFLDFLNDKSIPLIILSSSGCGEAIKLILKKYGRDYPNILYIVNQFIWNDSGRAVGIQRPIIHSLNKDETVLKDFPEIFEKVKDRKNVLLLGDSLGDVDMVSGFNYDSLLKIGFFNYKDSQQKDQFMEKYDVVIENDGDFSLINQFLLEIKD